MEGRFFLLNIQLIELEPAIWRDVVVPANITLDRLHDVIQIVMGWTDSHLHEFIIGKKRYTEHPQSKEDGLVDERYRLGDLIKQKGRSFDYLYDFGDHWQHRLVLLENRAIPPEYGEPVLCLAGERACPPEDVGGVGGFMEFCHALYDPSHEEHLSYKEWSGGNYDCEHFDIDAVNWELMKYLRWSRDRSHSWGGFPGRFA